MSDSANAAPEPLRRRFVKAVLGAISGVVAAILGIPLIGFFSIPALRRREVAWSEVGPIDEFEVGETRFVSLTPLVPQVWPEAAPKMGAFVSRKADGSFDVFHSHCTHAGCPINFRSAARSFFSPCHGGMFDQDGRVLAGPPPRPLDRYELRVENGVLFAGRIYKVNDQLEQVGWLHG
jgi:quinol---cytochrome c reductase iron-sulfur subunit, bacillus type